MGKHSNRKTMALAAGVAVVLAAIGVVFSLIADRIDAYIVMLILAVGTWIGWWLGRLGAAVEDVQRVAAATSTAALKTSERLTDTRDEIKTMRDELGAMRAKLSADIKAADKAAEKRVGNAGLGGTVAAMGVRLVGMSGKQDAIIATLRSLPCGQAGETTLPAQGNEPSDPPAPEPVTPGGPPDMPPSGVHASSNFGSALGASLERRSVTLDDPPPQSSGQPSEPGDESADDDGETTLFDRSQLPAPASDPKPSSGNPGKMAGWLARRAQARIERAQREREQRDRDDSSSAEAPSSDA